MKGRGQAEWKYTQDRDDRKKVNIYTHAKLVAFPPLCVELANQLQAPEIVSKVKIVAELLAKRAQREARQNRRLKGVKARAK